MDTLTETHIDALEVDAPEADGTSIFEWVLLAAATVSTVIFVVVGIQRPIWLDEAMAALISSQPPAGVLDSLSRENNQPLFYLLLSLWTHVFGNSEIAMRSLTALLYLAGCGVAYALGRRVAGTRRAACYSGFFYLASALAVRQAQNIRMYSLLGVLSGLSTMFFLRLFWKRDRTWTAWTLYVTVSAVGLLTHIWFVFVLFAQFVALAATNWREIWRFAVAGLLALVPLAVLWGRVLVSQWDNGATAWMPRLSPFLLIAGALEFYHPIATLALYFLGFMALRIHRHRGMALLGAIFAVTAAVPLVVSLVKPIYWPGRYAIIALPPLAAFLGCALVVHLPRRVLAGIGLLLLLVQVPAHIRARDTAPDTLLPADKTDRATAQFLLDRAKPGDAVVFTSLTRAAADYYLRRAGAASRFIEISYPREVATHMGSLELSLPPGRRAKLEIEAAEIVRKLQNGTAGGRTVWLYDGFATNLGAILKERVDQSFTLRREHPLEGPYHKRLLEYGPRKTTPE